MPIPTSTQFEERLETESVSSSPSSHSTPAPAGTVIAEIKLSLPERGREGWLKTWQNVAHAAKADARCSSCRLVANTCDDSEICFWSEWDDSASFNRFVREQGLIWLERSVQTRHRCYNVLPDAVLV